MLTSKIKKKLDAALGAKIKQKALVDFARKDIGRRDMFGYLALVISVFVIASPWLSALLGVWIASIDFPNLFALVPGVVLILVGWFLRPRAIKNNHPTLRRTEFPNLFKLLDEITAAMGAKPVDGVHLTDEFNAYLASFGRSKARETVVGIGIPLWLSLDHSQRVALLAHEIAHCENGDPARNGPTHRALHLLEGWQFLVSPTHVIDHEHNVAMRTDDDGMIADLTSGIMQILVGSVLTLLQRLMYWDSQKSEYLADGIGAEVAGVAASSSLLKVVALIPLADPAIRGMHVTRDSPLSIYGVMVDAVTKAPQNEQNAMFKEMEVENLTADSTHPPTRLRLAFLNEISVSSDSIGLDPELFAAIDQELASKISESEQHLRDRWIVQ